MNRRLLIPLALVCAGLTLVACTRRHSLFMSPGENEDAPRAKKPAAAPAAPAPAQRPKTSTF